MPKPEDELRKLKVKYRSRIQEFSILALVVIYLIHSLAHSEEPTMIYAGLISIIGGVTLSDVIKKKRGD